ncbi:MAG: Crp/Fnr family transcriptional regulator [Betaproteobacteria bacterium]
MTKHTELAVELPLLRRNRQPSKTTKTTQRAQTNSDFSTLRKNSTNPRTSLNCSAGLILYEAGYKGAAWRVISGAVRLDRQEPEGETSFASLAIQGDIIGAETMLFDAYSFTATALTPCQLVPWPEGEGMPVPVSDVLKTLIATEQRAAEVIALRYGQAAERVKRLIMLLASSSSADKKSRSKPDQPSNQVILPARQDMADITALTLETVSRMVSAFRRNGMLRHLSANCFRLSLLVPRSSGLKKLNSALAKNP